MVDTVSHFCSFAVAIHKNRYAGVVKVGVFEKSVD